MTAPPFTATDNLNVEQAIFVEYFARAREQTYRAVTADASQRFPVITEDVWSLDLAAGVVGLTPTIDPITIPNGFGFPPSTGPPPGLVVNGAWGAGYVQLCEVSLSPVTVGAATSSIKFGFFSAAAPVPAPVPPFDNAPVVAIDRVIPATWGEFNEEFGLYKPELFNSLGISVPYDGHTWVIDGFNRVIEFPSGAPPDMGTAPALPLLRFYRYCGPTAASGAAGVPVITPWYTAVVPNGGLGGIPNNTYMQNPAFPTYDITMATGNNFLFGSTTTENPAATPAVVIRTKVLQDHARGTFCAGMLFSQNSAGAAAISPASIVSGNPNDVGTEWNRANRGDFGAAVFGFNNMAMSNNSFVSGFCNYTTPRTDGTAIQGLYNAAIGSPAFIAYNHAMFGSSNRIDCVGTSVNMSNNMITGSNNSMFGATPGGGPDFAGGNDNYICGRLNLAQLGHRTLSSLIAGQRNTVTAAQRTLVVGNGNIVGDLGGVNTENSQVSGNSNTLLRCINSIVTGIGNVIGSAAATVSNSIVSGTNNRMDVVDNSALIACSGRTMNVAADDNNFLGCDSLRTYNGIQHRGVISTAVDITLDRTNHIVIGTSVLPAGITFFVPPPATGILGQEYYIRITTPASVSRITTPAGVNPDFLMPDGSTTNILLLGSAVPSPTTIMGYHIVLSSAAVGAGAWAVIGVMLRG
jgi:hypothetical protein